MVAVLASAALEILSIRGLGPVHIGMTVRQAVRAGVKLKLEDSATEGCAFASRADGTQPNVAYMVEAGVITRIDVGDIGSGKRRNDITAGRIGLGSTSATLRRAYGFKLRWAVNSYDDTWRDVTLDGPRHRRAIIFVLDEHHRVNQFRAGRYPSIAYIEGCD